MQEKIFSLEKENEKLNCTITKNEDISNLIYENSENLKNELKKLNEIFEKNKVSSQDRLRDLEIKIGKIKSIEGI